METDRLEISRLSLVRRLTHNGPPNETIRDQLVTWAEERADWFEMHADIETPLRRIGITDPDESTEKWLDAFNEGVQAELGLSDDQLMQRLADANNVTLEQLDQIAHQSSDTTRLHGIRVDVREP